MSKESHSFSKQLCLSNISVISLHDSFLNFRKHGVTVFPLLICLSSYIMPITVRKTVLYKTNTNNAKHPKINQL